MLSKVWRYYHLQPDQLADTEVRAHLLYLVRERKLIVREQNINLRH